MPRGLILKSILSFISYLDCLYFHYLVSSTGNVYLWGHVLNPEKYKLQTLHFSPHRSKIVFWIFFNTKCCLISGTYGTDIMIHYLKRFNSFRFVLIFEYTVFIFSNLCYQLMRNSLWQRIYIWIRNVFSDVVEDETDIDRILADILSFSPLLTKQGQHSTR